MEKKSIEQRVQELEASWKTPRWDGIQRDYSAYDVISLRGSYDRSHEYADFIADKFHALLQKEQFVRALGALSGNQAVQMAKAGLKAIYMSGWQVAADANLSGETYPDQSLYPVSSVPALVQRVNNALQREDEVDFSEGKTIVDYMLPIIADAEAGFGGKLNAYELMKAMIKSGAAAVHWEDQLSSEKKCGHLGGKVLVPIREHIEKLQAARLAADVLSTSTLIIARTDADSAKLFTSDIDERDAPFIDQSKGRTNEGFYSMREDMGLKAAIARGVAYAPYADLLWCETSTPDLGEALEFAQGIHKHFPGKWLAYNCSPSFNWGEKFKGNPEKIATFQDELAKMGYKFQFVTLAGFHALNNSMFELAHAYRDNGMAGYVQLQQREFANQEHGFTAVKHQREVGTGYFDKVAMTITGGKSATTAMKDSTETAQFKK
jgi:isocitrate lyase